MATASTRQHPVRSEARFFLIMACVMAAVIVGGFGFNVATGRSSFAAPPIVHVHAFVFMGWTALYVLQNALIAGNNPALHRKLGWAAVVLIPAMVILGITMTVRSLQTNGAPPFFDQNEFLFGNPVGILAFAGMAGWAITLRRQTDWHRRLMLCAMATLTGPGFGRLLPMPFLIPWGWWVANLVPLVFPLIGMLADRRRTGAVHPAWLAGMGIMLGALLLGDLLAYSQPGRDLTAWVVAGTPGADRAPTAFFPQ
ncbi:MAG: hypothetical protein WA842_05225 [Croceibacterium sp.]